MNVYAISDLHLSGLADKPMEVFGSGWEGHFAKIEKSWRETVREDDVVLICGDVSWGMKLEEGMYDVASLRFWKGTKIFCKGNHDYWWNGIGKVRSAAPDGSFFFLQNDCVKIGDCVFVGSRGWLCPSSNEYKKETDEKIYLREAERFRLAFRQAEKIRQAGDKLIALIHYPPFSAKKEDTLFSELFEKNGVDVCVFGHLHGGAYYPLEQEKNGIAYYLTSCDKLGFALKKIL